MKIKENLSRFVLLGLLAFPASAKEYHYITGKSIGVSAFGIDTVITQSSIEASKLLNVNTFSVYHDEKVDLVTYINDEETLCTQYVHYVNPIVINGEFAGVGYQISPFCGDYEITKDGKYIHKGLLKELRVITQDVIGDKTVRLHKIISDMQEEKAL